MYQTRDKGRRGMNIDVHFAVNLQQGEPSVALLNVLYCPSPSRRRPYQVAGSSGSGILPVTVLRVCPVSQRTQ